MTQGCEVAKGSTTPRVVLSDLRVTVAPGDGVEEAGREPLEGELEKNSGKAAMWKVSGVLPSGAGGESGIIASFRRSRNAGGSFHDRGVAERYKALVLKALQEAWPSGLRHRS
jgi:hypothetical protein